MRALPKKCAGGRVIAGRAVGTRELIAAAVVVVLLVIAGLALGGVFSGGKKHADTPTTTPSTTRTTTTSRVTTTASTTQPTNPSPLPVPTTTLKTGSNGAQVKQLQRALAQLGYKPGTVDGIFGPNTEAAVMRLQTSVEARGRRGRRSAHPGRPRQGAPERRLSP